jgi:hypothetical protein
LLRSAEKRPAAHCAAVTGLSGASDAAPAGRTRHRRVHDRIALAGGLALGAASGVPATPLARRRRARDARALAGRRVNLDAVVGVTTADAMSPAGIAREARG